MRHSDAFVQNRREQLVAFINQHQEVSTKEICQAFQISQSGARATLSALAREGRIQRTHGGAAACPTPLQVPVQANSMAVDTTGIEEYQAKMAIGKLAASLVQENDVVAICGGTTTHLMAHFLAEKENITVVTNSLFVAHALMGNPDIDVRVTGGALNHKKGSLYGKTAEAFFHSIRFTKFIFSADAINVADGATARDSNISALESQILERTEVPILIADSSKFNKRMAIDSIATFDDIRYLVTDERVNRTILNNLNAKGVHTLVAPLEPISSAI